MLGTPGVIARSGAQLPEVANRCDSLCGRVQRMGPHLSSEQPKPSDVVVMCRRVHSLGFGAPDLAQARDFNPHRASDGECSPASPRLPGVATASPQGKERSLSFMQKVCCF